MAKLTMIEGVGPVAVKKLNKANVTSTDSLLAQAATKKGRDAIAAKSGLSTRDILEWVNRVDLMRIKGVGRQYSDLLEASGVDTVIELAQRNPGNLFEKMRQINVQKNCVRSLPTANQVKDWVKQAKKLDRVVTH